MAAATPMSGARIDLKAYARRVAGAGVLVLVTAGCGDGSKSGSVGDGGTNSDLPTTSTGDSGNVGSDHVGLTCPNVGPLYSMRDDPNTGAVDVSDYCLGRINYYRATAGLAPHFLKSTAPEAVCCQAAEAKTAAEIGGHANGGCGWQAQGFCGGGRNPNGNVQGSVDWCPRLFFEEGPTGGHYQAMMGVNPRAIMCSFYAVSRDQHSIVVNYY